MFWFILAIGFLLGLATAMIVIGLCYTSMRAELEKEIMVLKYRIRQLLE